MAFFYIIHHEDTILYFDIGYWTFDIGYSLDYHMYSVFYLFCIILIFNAVIKLIPEKSP